MGKCSRTDQNVHDQICLSKAASSYQELLFILVLSAVVLVAFFALRRHQVYFSGCDQMPCNHCFPSCSIPLQLFLRY